MKTTMYVMTHKKFQCPKMEGYLQLHVGAQGKNDIGYKADNTGDNISIKNPNYCELTGLYWVWKNDQSSETVGISHYRRYFTKALISRKEKHYINQNDIEKNLEKYDVIVPKKEYYRETAFKQYCNNSGFEKDLNIVKKIIEKDYKEYIEAFDNVMNQNKMYQFNMLICSKEKYNEFCKWLFDILFQLEKQVDLSKGYNDYQKRIYGFLGERLLNIWINKNKLKIKEMRVINTEQKWAERLKISLRRVKNIMIYEFSKGKNNNGDNN